MLVVVLYYAQKLPDKNYRVVVVNVKKNVIVTAYISNKLKGGKVIW